MLSTYASNGSPALRLLLPCFRFRRDGSSLAMEGGRGRKKIVNAQSGSGKGGKVKEEKKERESGGTSKAKVELAETGTSKKGNPKPTKCGAQIYQGEQMIFSTLDLSYSNRVAGLSHASNPPTVKNHHQTRGYGCV